MVTTTQKAAASVKKGGCGGDVETRHYGLVTALIDHGARKVSLVPSKRGRQRLSDAHVQAMFDWAMKSTIRNYPDYALDAEALRVK